MVCNTQSDAVKKIQDGVLEFLLVNHPLDCPVCDRGGECPLQDQTLAFGPGESRFIEEKRHFEKPIPLSDLVLLDRERCIQCGRCTRFADEIAGDPLIDFVDRGDRMQVLNFAEQPFDSYFSGNTVQICPVGALTAKPVPLQGPAVGPRDGRDVVQRVRGAVPRRAAVVVEPARAAARRRLRAGQPRLAVRQGPLRHRVGALRAPRRSSRMRRGRRRAPRGVVAGSARRGGGAAPRRARAARSRVDRAARRRAQHQRGRVRVRPADEGRDRHRQRRRADRRRPARRGRARPAPRARSPTATAPPRSCCSAPTSKRSCRCSTCACAAPRWSSACRSSTSRPVAHGLTEHATDRRPHDARARSSAPTRSTHIARRARRSPRPGRRRARPLVARRVGGGRDARRARRCATLPDVRFLSALRRGNVHGAIDSGLVPGLPARPGVARRRPRVVRVGVGRAGSRRARGSTRSGILEAAAAGKIEVLVIFGSDPVADFPDADLARRGDRRREAHDRGRRVPHRHVAPRRGRAAVHALGREDRQRHEPRRPRAARRPEGRARGRGDGRLAHRGRARAAARHRLRLRDRRRGHRRARTRRARARRRRRRRCCARPATAWCCRCASTATRSCCARAALSILADDGSGTSWDPIKVEGEAARRASKGSRRSTPRPSDEAGEADGADAGAAPRRPRSGTWDGAVPDARGAAARRVRSAPRGRVGGSTTTDAWSAKRRRSRACAGRSRCASARTTRPVSASSRAREVRVTSTRGSQVMTDRDRRRRARGHRAARLLRRRHGRGRADRRERRRSPTCAWRRSDEPAGERAARARSAVQRRRCRGRCSRVVLIKVVIAFVILLVSVMLYIWGMRKVIADMQNRIGPNRAGPYGVLQTLADGIKLFFKEQSIPTTADRPRVPPRAVPVDPARVPDVLRRPDRRHGLDPRAHDVPAGRRSPDRRAVHPRDVGPRRVRRDARGLVVGLEVPAARRGALDRAAALVRGRVRARDPRRAHPGADALDARDRRRSRRGSTRRSFVARLVLAARARAVRRSS